MSKPKFTPGPWKAGKNACMTTVLDGHEGKTIYPKGSSYHIAWANAENSNGDLDIETALANAALIAAAPEMYKLLAQILKYEPKGVSLNFFDRMNPKIANVLRKARGESEDGK